MEPGTVECDTPRKKENEKEKKPAVIPSLVHLTSQWIRDHLHLSYVSNIVAKVPNELLELLLDGCTPDQLLKIELHAERDLGLVTEDIWRTHCRTFLNNRELNDKGLCYSWKEFYQQLLVQYEKKKMQTGKHLRSLYDEQAKERASKKIKVLDAAPVASKTRSSFGTTFSGYNKPVSKQMEKCLKDARKSQAAMAWRKPQVTVKTTIISKQTTFMSPKPTNNIRPTNTILPKQIHSTNNIQKAITTNKTSTNLSTPLRPTITPKNPTSKPPSTLSSQKSALPSKPTTNITLNKSTPKLPLSQKSIFPNKSTSQLPPQAKHAKQINYV